MAVVATAERGLIVYQLENQPSEFRRIDSPLKHQVSPMFFVEVRHHGSYEMEKVLEKYEDISFLKNAI